MFDVSPLWLLDDAEHALEVLSTVGGADSPQARRTAVLVAEAVAAGQDDAVTHVFVDWARIFLNGGHTTERVPLAQVATAAQAIVDHVLPEREQAEVETFLHEIASAPHDTAGGTVAFELAAWTLDRIDRPSSTHAAADAWEAATRILGAITGSGAASELITACADCARRRLLILVS